MSSHIHQTQEAKQAEVKKANGYCAIALVLMSFALSCYGIGVFLISPTSIVGIVFFCLGLLCMAGSTTCFALYARYSKIAEKM